MPLEALRKNINAQLAESVHALGPRIQRRLPTRPLRNNHPLPPRKSLKTTEVSADVARARSENHTHVAVRGLGAQRRTENAQQVEVRQVIRLPFGVYAVDCEGARGRLCRAAAQDYAV
jgi:hypothetical protein